MVTMQSRAVSRMAALTASLTRNAVSAPLRRVKSEFDMNDINVRGRPSSSCAATMARSLAAVGGKGKYFRSERTKQGACAPKSNSQRRDGEVERSPLAWLGLDPDTALVPLDNFFTHRQPNA